MVWRCSALDLVSSEGASSSTTPCSRDILLTNRRVEREEMRTFLESCQGRVVVTGDQSLAEAVVLGKDLLGAGALEPQGALALLVPTASLLVLIPCFLR